MLTFRKSEENDIPLIASCLKNTSPDFASQCGYGSLFFTFPVREKQLLAFQCARPASLFFTILNDTVPIGSFELCTSTTEDTRREGTVARFLIAREHRHQGYGEAALKQLVAYAFSDLWLHKVKLSVYDFNESARRCYQKAGFTEVSRKIRDNGWVVLHMERQNPAFS